MTPFSTVIHRLPLLMALGWFVIGGVFLLNRQAAQARDTIRKHHLDDIEHSLYYTYGKKGTYPPYDQLTWCGFINDEHNAQVHADIETALRESNVSYGNLNKPFPTDPAHTDYFYWKKSPAAFELYAVLEAARTKEKSNLGCATSIPTTFDYGLVSVWRQ